MGNLIGCVQDSAGRFDESNKTVKRFHLMSSVGCGVANVCRSVGDEVQRDQSKPKLDAIVEQDEDYDDVELELDQMMASRSSSSLVCGAMASTSPLIAIKSPNAGIVEYNALVATKNAPAILWRLLSVAQRRKFDMGELHPPSPPFLGSSYWMPAPSPPSPTVSPSRPKNMTPPPKSVFVASAVLVASPLDTAINGLEHPTTSSPRRQHYRQNAPSLLNGTESPAEDTSHLRLFSETPSLSSTIQTYATGSLDADSGEALLDVNDTDFDFETGNDSVIESITPRRLFGEADKGHDPDGDDDAAYFRTSSGTPFSPSSSPSGESANSSTFITAASKPSGVCGSYTRIFPLSRKEKDENNEQKKEQIDSPPQNFCSSKKDSDSSLIIHNGVLVRGTPHTPSSERSLSSAISASDNNAGMERPLGIGKQRHINTLPSFQKGKPIRLRVTESYDGYVSMALNSNGASRRPMSQDSTNDYRYLQNQFSYDPYFSLGQYFIATASGKPYGNGLSIQMGSQYMTLRDEDGRVIAVTRSRHTFVPSHIIYSSKPRFPNQIPSSHRPMVGDQYIGGSSSRELVDLYPWALVRKEGRRMDHAVTIHMVEKQNSTSGDNKLSVPPLIKQTSFSSARGAGPSFPIAMGFSSAPAYRSRHGFDGTDDHTHTVVTRVVTKKKRVSQRVVSGAEVSVDENRAVSCDKGTTVVEEELAEEAELPCSLIIRDAIDRDVFNVTIAPGIDPLLIVCYLAVHAKMDVEPKLGSDQ